MGSFTMDPLLQTLNEPWGAKFVPAGGQISRCSHHGAQLPGHELVVADAQRFALGRLARRGAQDQLDKVRALCAAVDPTFLAKTAIYARTEGFNRIIKNTKRVACGFRNH